MPGHANTNEKRDEEFHMYNSILETRSFNDGVCRLTLQINENEYFSVYDSLSEEDASELVNNYLKYRVDDGRPENIELKHDRSNHIVTIETDLYYTDNEKTTEMLQAQGYLKNNAKNIHSMK